MADNSVKLAINGGKPVREKPLPDSFPGASYLGEEEKKAVMEVMDSKGLFRFYGISVLNKVSEFEKAFAKRMQVKHALGVSSGTGALLCGLSAIEVGPGDEVIVPGYTFVASAGAVVAVKAIPVLCEIDETIMIDPKRIEKKITDKTKAIMAVHMRGTPCDMDPIMQVAKKHNLKVIEDVAQATGASYKGKPLGSIGDVGCFSFQYHKILTAGEGGAVITNDDGVFIRAAAFHDHGHFPDREFSDMSKNPMLGINFRMGEIAGAILCEQLKKLDTIIGAMRKNRDRIIKGLKGIDGIKLRPNPDLSGDIGVCAVFFVNDAEKAKKIAEALKAENITGAWRLFDSPWHNYHYWDSILEKRTVTKEGCPFTCPYYGREIEYKKGMLPKTDDILSRCIHIDIAPSFSEQDCRDIIEGVKKVTKAIL